MAGTAAKKLRGYEGQLYYTLGSGTKTKLAHVTDITVDVKADSIDFSDHDTDGWKDTGSGLKAFSGTATVNYFTNDASQDDIYDALIGTTDITLEFRPLDAVGETFYSGVVNVTGYSMKSPNSGAQTADITFDGRGPLAKGSIVAPA
jgi:predicted secreted protein